MIGLTGWKLILSFIFEVIIGIAGCMGVGCFSLQMCMLYFLGMSAAVCFPIMMSAVAFLQIANCNGFITTGQYVRKVAMAFNITGMIGILIGAFVIGSMDIGTLQWLVCFIVYFAGILLLVQTFSGMKKMSKTTMQE